jgi:hypothetical protein
MTRDFQRPPHKEGWECLALRLESVPGLVEVRLNGQPLPTPASCVEPIYIPLPSSLPRRNRLEIRVDPLGLESVKTASFFHWGGVALVIRPSPPAHPALDPPGVNAYNSATPETLSSADEDLT